jgi:hypothetical protein
MLSNTSNIPFPTEISSENKTFWGLDFGRGESFLPFVKLSKKAQAVNQLKTIKTTKNKGANMPRARIKRDDKYYQGEIDTLKGKKSYYLTLLQKIETLLVNEENQKLKFEVAELKEMMGA